MAGNADRLGIYGSVQRTHRRPDCALAGPIVYASREPYTAAQDFARRLGAVWPGIGTKSPKAARCGHHLCSPGTGAAAARGYARAARWYVRHPHERDSELPYNLLWEERSCVVANLTARTAGFPQIAPRPGVRTKRRHFRLLEQRSPYETADGTILGAAVLKPRPTGRQFDRPYSPMQTRLRISTDPATHRFVHRIDTHAASVFSRRRPRTEDKRAVRFPFWTIQRLKAKAPCDEEIKSIAHSRRKLSSRHPTPKATMDR